MSIVHVPDATSRAACRIGHLPDITSRAMSPGVHVLDATSRDRDCFVDAPDTASWAQCVHLCLPVMMLSELSVCVFVPDSAFMLMCCNFHALMPFPGLYVV